MADMKDAPITFWIRMNTSVPAEWDEDSVRSYVTEHHCIGNHIVALKRGMDAIPGTCAECSAGGALVEHHDIGQLVLDAEALRAKVAELEAEREKMLGFLKVNEWSGIQIFPIGDHDYVFDQEADACPECGGISPNPDNDNAWQTFQGDPKRRRGHYETCKSGAFLAKVRLESGGGAP